jgi:hypothetical protein
MIASLGGPCEHGAAGDDESHAEDDPTVSVFPEHYPGQDRSQHRLEVQ